MVMTVPGSSPPASTRRERAQCRTQARKEQNLACVAVSAPGTPLLHAPLGQGRGQAW